MSAVSEAIVREFFESAGFFVRQHRKHVSPARREDDEIDFAVSNPHPVEFGTILAALIESTEANRNYQKSDVLQMLRILKQHGFLNEPQLELFRARRKPRAAKSNPAPDPP